MINLIEVNAYALTTLEELKSASCDRSKAEQILEALKAKSADRSEILNKLSAKAEEIGSDNLWNRYESAGEAYGYALQLIDLIEEYLSGDTDYDELEWQIDDVATKSQREAFYRLERAQW